MSKNLPNEDSSSALKNLLKKLSSARTPNDIARVLLEGNANLSHTEMSRLQDIANKTLEDLKQEEMAKSKVNTNQLSQDLATKVEAQIQKEQSRHDLEVEPVYRKFDSFSKNLLLEQEATIKNLEEALASNSRGEAISEELKSKLTLSPEDLERRKSHWRDIDETHKVATREKAHHQQRIAEIDKQHPNLDAEHERHPLKVQRNFHQTLLQKADTKLQEVEKHYELRKEAAVSLDKGIKQANVKNKGFWSEHASQFKEEHGVSHEEILSTKSSKDILHQRSDNFKDKVSAQRQESFSKPFNKIKTSLQEVAGNIESGTKKLLAYFKADDKSKPDLQESKVTNAKKHTNVHTPIDTQAQGSQRKYSKEVNLIRESLKAAQKSSNPTPIVGARSKNITQEQRTR